MPARDLPKNESKSEPSRFVRRENE
jgi:hypothetical protein